MARREGTSGMSETMQEIILRSVQLLDVIDSFRQDKD
jgi:hypothetical protein